MSVSRDIVMWRHIPSPCLQKQFNIVFHESNGYLYFLRVSGCGGDGYRVDDRDTTFGSRLFVFLDYREACPHYWRLGEVALYCTRNIRGQLAGRYRLRFTLLFNLRLLNAR